MQFYKFLAPMMLSAMVGMTACDSGSSTDPNPSQPDQPGIGDGTGTGIGDGTGTGTGTVITTPTTTVALAPNANVIFPNALYEGWKAFHYVTLEDESVYYASVAPDFYEGVFQTAAYLPAARVKWSTQSSTSYYGAKCAVPSSTISAMKYRACTVSEGMGYGMLIALFQNDLEAYNRMWNYTKAFRDYNNVKLMPWITRSFLYDEVDNSSATDADLDIATSLILMYFKTMEASYLADAFTLMNALWTEEVNKTNYLLYSGNTSMWTGADPAYNLSYFSPVALRLFAAVDPDPTHEWTKVLDAMYAYMMNIQATGTGVIPDWSNTAGIPVDPNNGSAGKTYWTFNKEAVRVPWRIAWDYLWYQDARAASVLTTLNNFISVKAGGDPNSAALAYNYSANLASGADIAGTTVQTHWYGAWCLTAVASNPAWLSTCTDVFNTKTMLNTNSSYFLDILQMMMSQLLNGSYVRPF